jgi:uncharacterized damage-inducible protein DinB
MNADNIRNLFDYHFRANRKIWDECIVPMSDKQFREKIDYSLGSIRNQCVHLWNIDERWFCGFRGVEVVGFANPVHYGTKEVVRREWDRVEGIMKEYLATVQDEDLQKPYEAGLAKWQVFFHLINHGTDHRAQLLAMLNQMGVKTFPQDYVFFAWGKL